MNNQWPAFMNYAERHAGATRVSDHLIEARGLRFCENGNITIPTLDKWGREIGQRTIAKGRTPYQMFLLLKILTEQAEQQAGG